MQICVHSDEKRKMVTETCHSLAKDHIGMNRKYKMPLSASGISEWKHKWVPKTSKEKSWHKNPQHQWRQKMVRKYPMVLFPCESEWLLMQSKAGHGWAGVGTDGNRCAQRSCWEGSVPLPCGGPCFGPTVLSYDIALRPLQMEPELVTSPHKDIHDTHCTICSS